MTLSPHVIICRPLEKATELAQLFEHIAIDSTIIPMIEIVKGKDAGCIFDELALLPRNSPVFLLSPNIFKYIDYSGKKYNQDVCWRNDLNYFAIGSSTATAFKEVSRLNAYYPLNDEVSETIIKLPVLNQLIQNTALCYRKVAILRGNGGRDVISNFMKINSYAIKEYEMYKRVAIHTNNEGDWQKILDRQTIFIVTSAEILTLLEDRLKKYLPQVTKLHQQANLVVVSHRIKKMAHEMGWKKISVTQSAHNLSLFDMVKEIIECEKKQENYPY